MDTNPQVEYAIPKERYEAKYIIPTSMLPGIREFVKPFCVADKYGRGDPPEYDIYTLQLDSPDLTLHHAKDRDLNVRFKLRARTYGYDRNVPIFAEIKRKIKRTIAKSRAEIPRDKWCEDLVLDPYRLLDVDFRSREEEIAFLDFVRLTREIGARPAIVIKYTRESYMSIIDEYARVTFDKNLGYQATDSWTSFGENGTWIPIDTSLVQNKLYGFSGVVLELKMLHNVPRWIEELVKHFELVQTGHCKYSNAIWAESIFRGTSEVPMYASELLNF